MKQLMTLFIAGAFMASVPAIANEDFSSQGNNDEYTATVDQQQPDEMMNSELYLMPHPGRGMPGHPGNPGRGGPGWGRGPGHGGPGRGGPGWGRGPGRGGPGWGRGCPPGTRRQADMRWDRRLRRWVQVGWTCRAGIYSIDSESGEVVQ